MILQTGQTSLVVPSISSSPLAVRVGDLFGLAINLVGGWITPWFLLGINRDKPIGLINRG